MRFRREGFLLVPGLVSAAEVESLRHHTELLMQGNLPEQQETTAAEDRGDTGGAMQKFQRPPENLSPEEKALYWLRIHMLHRQLAIHEQFLLHPRVLDVLECLIGPDVMAMQSMMFFKGPGKAGQGWHQDSYYIPTHPDSLCGAWLALDDCDEYNGAMWFAQGSQVEPVYPPSEGDGFGDVQLGDIHKVAGVSKDDDSQNDLAKIADRYPQVLAKARAGDVVFFGGHVLHRSKRNNTTDRFRRSFVGHYANARSFTQWGADEAIRGDKSISDKVDPITKMTNGSHILARGDTHLPFAKPRFGTKCAAMLSAEERRCNSAALASMMMGDMSSDMGAKPAQTDREDD